MFRTGFGGIDQYLEAEEAYQAYMADKMEDIYARLVEQSERYEQSESVEAPPEASGEFPPVLEIVDQWRGER